MQDADFYKALANDKRLAVLEWLKDPCAHFPPQADGDLVEDGVCALYIAEKLGVGQATLSEHMRVLVRANLLTTKKIKQWTLYRRNEPRIDMLKAELFARI